MGVWTWLDRHDRGPFERAMAGAMSDAWLDAKYDDSSQFRAVSGHVAGMHTHRAWHALHVALTGEEADGLAPARHVVWTTPGAREVSMTSARFVHAVETVREVADYLRTLDEDRVVADLCAARELGVYVYSFEGWEGELDMVQCGCFQRVLRAVAKFYLVAASEAQVVVVRRG